MKLKIKAPIEDVKRELKEQAEDLAAEGVRVVGVSAIGGYTYVQLESLDTAAQVHDLDAGVLMAKPAGEYPEVESYADLPAAIDFPGAVVLVATTTGTIFISRKRAGLYRSDGNTWERLGTIEYAGAESPTPGLLPSNPPIGMCVVTNIYFDPILNEHVVEYNIEPTE